MMLLTKNDPDYIVFASDVNHRAKTNPSVLENSHEGAMERVKLMPLQWFIQAIRQLPDVVMEQHGLSIGFDNSNTHTQFFAAVRTEYRAKADWLEYLLLDKTHLLAELRFTNKADYKPQADLSHAWYKLAQETILLSGQMEEYAGRAAMLLWLIEYELCETMLEQSGFTGSPDPMSKSELYSYAVEMCKSLYDPEKLPKQESKTLYNPSSILLNVAALLASDAKNTKFRAHWQDFLAKYKRHYREIERSPLQIYYLEDGEIKYIGKGKRKKRGFGA